MSEIENFEEEEEEEFECSSCREYFPILMEKVCEICKSGVCEKCREKSNNIYLEEWLDECTNECYKCKRLGCGNCINTCHQCWNIGEEHNFFCDDCSTLQRNCEYHNSWNLCADHFKEECSVCKSNKNYSDRMSFM